MGRLFNFIVERLLKMKYCPYCGAALPDSAVSFCPECGKPMQDGDVKTPSKPQKTELIVEDDYDGYYDDRIPIDEGHRRDGPDKGIIKKVVALVLCLLVVIGACVAILYVL